MRSVQLAVECRGPEIVARVNGHEIGRVCDAGFGDGYVGMSLFGPGHAVFPGLVAEEMKWPRFGLSDSCQGRLSAKSSRTNRVYD